MLKTLRSQTGTTLMEVMIAGVIFAVLGPGLLLVTDRGMRSFFFQRDELVVHSDMRYAMDRMTDRLRQSTTVTTAEVANVVFDPDSSGYHWDSQNKNLYDREGNQLNSQGIEVTDFSFSYYAEDTTILLDSPVDAGQVKAVGITMKFKANHTPVMQLESWVLIRSLL